MGLVKMARGYNATAGWVEHNYERVESHAR